MNNELDLPASRLGSLYRDFRDLKDLNPEGYQANINTWKKYFIKHILNDKHTLSVECGKKLLHKLSIDIYGEPKSIDVALDSFIAENILIPSETFFDTNKANVDGNSPSNVNLLTKLFGLLGLENKKGYTTRSTTDRDTYLKDVDLIIKGTVEAAIPEITANIQSNIINGASEPSDFVLSRKLFLIKSGISEKWNNKLSQDIIVFYLQYYSKVIVSNGETIKVCQTSSEAADKIATASITEVDDAIVDIKGTLLLLNRQTKKLEDDITGIENKLHSKVFKSLSNKAQKDLIRNKILSQRYLEKLYGNQNNLNDMLHQINVSVSNRTMFDTLQKSHEAIKSINTYIESVEKVTELLDSIDSENEKATELNDLLSNSSDATNEIADDVIDNELAELEQEMASEDKKTAIPVEETVSPEDDSELLKRLKEIKIGETDSKTTKENETIERKEKIAQPAT
ncbi:Charged multivesicular body protein 7 [Maudiozyma exigua]|uniref:Charged multivesicular body protein 7 n=1 Tax=Maudiozyma exigua TaxID=34358 RepID=A0A9P6WEH8_MAUEX|nr:Charged multivesicular body protein 7 [Kazachstania exigua]